MDAPEKRVSAGRVLGGKWCIQEQLGAGGMATVWSATHSTTDLSVAVKVLRAELSGHDRVVERFLREGYVANKVDHPGVVRVIDDGVTADGVAFLVMDLLHGHTLKQAWEQAGRQLSAQLAADVMVQVLEVLCVAHAAGVVHRDIKPDNVFITDDEQIKLLDFGVARLRELGSEEHHTRTGALLGTPAYMAPEQALGRWEQVDERSDCFAAGATLWTLLTGELVHRANTPQELLVAAATARPTPIRSKLPELSEAIAEVIDRALQPEPQARWQSAQAMRAGLANAAAGRPPEPASADTMASGDLPTDSAHAVPAPWRRSAALTGAAVGLMALAALAWLGTRPEPPATIDDGTATTVSSAASDMAPNASRSGVPDSTTASAATSAIPPNPAASANPSAQPDASASAAAISKSPIGASRPPAPKALPPFDERAARSRLWSARSASRLGCKFTQGPESVSVTITWNNDGSVREVQVPRSRFSGSAACVRNHYLGCSVPPFSGPSGIITQVINFDR